MSGQRGKEATKEGGRMVEGMGGRAGGREEGEKNEKEGGKVKRERGRQGRMEGRKE